MPNFKVNFLFNAGRQGWAETWYLVAADGDTALATATAVGQARDVLCAETVFLEAVRVSDEDILFDSRLEMAPGEVNPDAVAHAMTQDVPAVGMLVRVEATSLYRRQWWLRGLPDDWVRYNAEGDQAWSAEFDAAFGKLAGQIIKAGFCIKAISKAPALFKQITAVAPAVAPLTGVVVTAAGHGLLVGDLCRVRGVKSSMFPTRGFPGNGVWQVQAVTTDSFTINAPWATGDAYLAGGKVQKRMAIYAPITELTPLRAGKRDTGRAFFVPRGRANTRAR